MKRSLCLCTLLLVIAGCQTTEELLDSQQQEAIDTALVRSRFNMNCPSASAVVLSRKLSSPSVGSSIGISRAIYTLGIEGCGKRETSVVSCPQDGTGCVSGE